MQRRANDFVSRQGARSKEHRHTLLRDRGVQAEEGQQKPSPHHLRNRLSPHPDEAREMSVSEPFWMMEGNQEERRFPRKPASFRRNPLSPETPKQSERGPYLQATPEEEEEEEGEEGIGVGAGSGSRDPRWGDDGVCGTPDTEDSDLYCSDEEDRIEFTVGADKENADVVCDEDSRYSLERVFVNQYLSNSIVQPTHTSHLPVKASTSKIVGGRMTSTGDAGATDTSRSKNAQHHHRPSLNVSSGSVKSSADNKWRTRSQGTEDCHTMVTCLSEPTLRWENPAQQLDNQLRKARLTLASLRDTIKSDI